MGSIPIVRSRIRLSDRVEKLSHVQFQNPGKHTILVKALDKADNSIIASGEFTIKPLWSPIITKWFRQLQNGEILTIQGETKYPNIQINLWLQHEKDDAEKFVRKEIEDIEKVVK